MVTLTPISDFHSLRKLNEGETIQSFNCGDTELNDFIINKAAKYRDELLAVSYVLEENDSPIAYFSLSNDNLSYEKFQQKTSFNRLNRAIDNAKRMKQYPAVNTYNPERRTQSMFFDLAQLL